MKPFDGTFELVDPKLIQVDRKYQRTEKWPLISAIAKGPRWQRFVAIPCVRHELKNGDVYYTALDCQQRLLGVLSSDDPPALVPVIWWPAEGVQIEARDFVAIAVTRKSLSAIEKFKASVTAQDPASVAIQNALDRHGYSVSAAANDSTKTITAIGGFLAVYNAAGEAGLDVVLEAHDAYWPDEKLTGSILGVLAEVLGEHSSNGGLSADRFASLAKTSPGRIMRKAEDIYHTQGGSKRAALRKALKALTKI